MIKKLFAAGLILLNAWISNAHQQNTEHIGESDIPQAVPETRHENRNVYLGAASFLAGAAMVRAKLQTRFDGTQPVLQAIMEHVDYKTSDGVLRVKPSNDQAEFIKQFIAQAQSKGATAMTIKVEGQKPWRLSLNGSPEKLAEHGRFWMASEWFKPLRWWHGYGYDKLHHDRPVYLKAHSETNGRWMSKMAAGTGLALAGTGLVLMGSWAMPRIVNWVSDPSDERRETLLTELRLLQKAMQLTAREIQLNIAIERDLYMDQVTDKLTFRKNLSDKEWNLWTDIVNAGGWEAASPNKEDAAIRLGAYQFFKLQFHERLKKADAYYPTDDAFEKFTAWSKNQKEQTHE